VPLDKARQVPPAIKSKQSELVALRGKWFKERSRLYDRETGLPTVAVLMDDLKTMLDEKGSISVLVFRPSSEGHVEEVWGWEAYDDLLLDFVRRLKAFQTDGIVPGGTFCLPYVRSDEIILLIGSEGGGIPEGPVALGQKAAELDQLIRGYLAERADVSARFRSFVGAARIMKDPKHRLERVVYRGIQEARDQVTRQTVRQEIRGGELLQDAISRRDISPVFQPVFDLATGNMIGMEALSRGPRGSEFESGETLFSLAERTELLVPLERVCRQRSLEAAAEGNNRRQIFLNLSPAAASDPEFLGPLFRDQVLALGLEPDRIVLEITERTYAVYEGLFREVLSKFRSQNFRIAVDDVGTGYSNLSSLADIEPDYLKFDNVFVRGIDRRQVKQDLLEALMSFARKMHTKVIAEGIETREELRVLQSLGVPYGQGFLLARPMPVGEIERFATINI
jgi:EAL domain-containing protein (putative c-di-GMP-specific phosphodiesterase class I)/GGDEF domain-containing protein